MCATNYKIRVSLNVKPIIDGSACLLSNFVENFMHRLNSHKDKGGGQEEA